MRSSRIICTIAPVYLALAVAACGGSNDDPAVGAPPKPPGGRAMTVGVANSGLGNILVDAQGRTLYLFEKDSGTKSACSGACAVDWPPVRADGKPTAGRGVTASKVGTTQRSDGNPQVTYSGHPLYLFQGDKHPGDTNGQALNAFGAPWYVLSPAGNAITGSGTTSSGGGSNGY